MDILLQSDGQLHPPRRQPPKPPPPKKEPLPEPCPPEPCAESACPAERSLPWEELLLIGVAFLLLRSSDHPDLPLLIALAYILLDRDFSLKGLL